MSFICYFLFLSTFTAVAFGEDALIAAKKDETVVAQAAPNLPEVPKLPVVAKTKEVPATVPSVTLLVATDIAPADVGADTPKKIDSAPVEVQYDDPALQQDATENSASLRIVPMVAALLSFGALLSFTCIFLMKNTRRRNKGQGHGPTPKGKPPALSDELDFDDLENALGMPPSPTTPSRKQVHSQELENMKIVAPQEETDVSTNGWANDLESDAGWGEDAWADNSWDDVVDFEGQTTQDADLVEVAMAVPVQAKPALPRKGKAD